jgi:uncharacterized protein YbjT (DUF2867 family)
MSTYVVAGATGRVGSIVASELLARGHEVKGIVRNADRAAAWSAGGGKAAIGSLDDRAFLTRTLVGTAGFFALLPEDPFSPDFHGGRRRMADAMTAAVRDANVPHVVLLSAIAAVLADGNGPAKDLHYFEAALRATGTKVTIVRACWFLENLGAVVPAAKFGGIYPNMMLSSEAAFPTIATRDVGQVVASLLVSPAPASEVIDLVGPSYSPRDLASALGTSLGTPLQVVDIPPAARARTLAQAGLPASFAELVAELYSAFDSGRVRPQGDRAVAATTTVQDVLPGLLARAGAAPVADRR